MSCAVSIWAWSAWTAAWNCPTRCLLLIVLLLGLITRRHQLGIAREIELGALQLRFVLCFGRFGLIQCRLVWPRIDLEQLIAGLDLLALLEEHLGDLPVDAAAHIDGVERLNRPEPLHIDREHLASRQSPGSQVSRAWELAVGALARRRVRAASQRPPAQRAAANPIRTVLVFIAVHSKPMTCATRYLVEPANARYETAQDENSGAVIAFPVNIRRCPEGAALWVRGR